MSKITDKIIEQRMITEIKSSIMDRILEDIIKLEDAISDIKGEDKLAEALQVAEFEAKYGVESFDEEKNFESWVIGIAKYQIKAYLKKNKNAPDLVPLNLGREGEGYVSNENPDLWLADIPFAELLQKERRELRGQIRSKLTKKQKIIL